MFLCFLSNHDTSVVGRYQEQPSSTGRFHDQSRETRGILKELQVGCTMQRFRQESCTSCSSVSD